MVNWYIGKLVDWSPTNVPIYQPKEDNVEGIYGRLTALNAKLEHIRGRL